MENEARKKFTIPKVYKGDKYKTLHSFEINHMLR